MDDILAPRFIDAVAARKYLESIRWPDGAECPHCGLIKATAVTGGRDGLYQCNNCREQFTVTVGTVFERSKIALNKWLLATHLLCASKKGMSAAQIARMLGVTYKTAWFMMHRIREAMKDDGSPLGGEGKVVESDEAFVGGSKKKRLSRKTAPMKKVVTLVERDGRARSFHVANLHANNIRGAIVTNVDRASALMTDDARFYWDIGREFASHGRVMHGARQFSKGGGVHSNTAENFFSILKRGVIGTYHHWSAAHMHRYLAEFDFRYSTKDVTDRERADKALKGIGGKRLTYRRTCAKQRNNIVHAVWGANKRYPKAIIRVETFEGDFIKYTVKDFADTVGRIKAQIAKVSEFDEKCREIRISSPQPTLGGPVH